VVGVGHVGSGELGQQEVVGRKVLEFVHQDEKLVCAGQFEFLVNQLYLLPWVAVAASR
jgi:hypothetical protein